MTSGDAVATNNKIVDGWFREVNSQWPGQAWSLEVDEVLHDQQSDFQHVLVFRNKGPWGNVLVLDGCVQVTDKCEYTYHEMMAHTPLFSHPCPKNVLIIGGGDGGVLREVLKHPSVESCHLVDIDGMVIDVSKTYFPQIACAMQHPKAHVIVGDGFAYLEDKVNLYDVIIVDSSDPEGPASQLFGKEFYLRLHRALREGGYICTQAECMWLHLPMIQQMLSFITDEIGFHGARYGAMSIPFYPTGTLGCIVAWKGDSCCDVMTGPIRPVDPELLNHLQYYNPATHTAIFQLPNGIHKALYRSATSAKQ